VAIQNTGQVIIFTMEKEHIYYQQLDATKITETVITLSQRIDERFPDSGLHKVCEQLVSISQRAQMQAQWIDKPILSLRIVAGVLITLILAALISTLSAVNPTPKTMTVIQFIPVLESAINDIVLIAIAIFFLATLERRFKRHRALRAIHELRAIAHIIDMHQLNKDPVRLHWESKGILEPKHSITPVLMTRYLDYCSELLSIVGKIAVLYVQSFNDPVALSAVNEVEQLTTGLSRKIWQKLMIFQTNNTSH